MPRLINCRPKKTNCDRVGLQDFYRVVSQPNISSSDCGRRGTGVGSNNNWYMVVDQRVVCLVGSFGFYSKCTTGGGLTFNATSLADFEVGTTPTTFVLVLLGSLTWSSALDQGIVLCWHWYYILRCRKVQGEPYCYREWRHQNRHFEQRCGFHFWSYRDQ